MNALAPAIIEGLPDMQELQPYCFVLSRLVAGIDIPQTRSAKAAADKTLPPQTLSNNHMSIKFGGY